LGIGTSSPTTTLDVIGNANFGAAILTGSGVSTGNVQLELGANRSGNGPAYVDLHSTAGSDYEARLIRYAGANGGLDLIQTGTGGIVITNEGNADTAFKTNALERMRITNTGNVGIGTNSPTSLLDVNGNTEVAGTLFLGASNHGNLGSDATQLFLRGNNIALQNAAGSTTYAYINSSGNVGIGTASPETVLDINGSQIARGDANGYVYFAPKNGTTPFGANYDRFEIRVDSGPQVTTLGNVNGGTGAARALAFLTGNNERFRILTTGGITSSDLPNAVGYKGVPQSTNTTAAVGDIGKHIYVSTSVTINASVFSAGDSFVIVNSNTATTSINIVAGAGVTLRLAGTTTSGTPRPILPNGMASVLCVVGGASPVFLISGAGVT
jgi:hypothetical protein